MKDITITRTFLCRELWIVLICFILAFAANVVAVIVYVRPAIELLSQLGFVVAICIVLYILLWIVRLIVLAIVTLLRLVSRK